MTSRKGTARRAPTIIFPLLILLLAAIFNIHALVRDVRFHPDEAFFTTFARNAAVNGDWLLSGALDKPPLTIYTSALSLTFIGVHTDDNGVLHLDTYRGEFAARVPNVLATILFVAVLYALTKTIYGSRSTAAIAALLGATSPFLIAFSATTFMDMLMLLLMTFSLWMVVQGKWVRSGFFLILSIASKPQGIIYLPLILGVGWIMGGLNWRTFIRFIVPIVFGGFILWLWDSARPETSVFIQGAINNAPEGWLSSFDQIIPRLTIWLDYGQVMFGTGWLTGLLILIAIGYLISRTPIGRICRSAPARIHPHHRGASVYAPVHIDILLAIWMVGYFLFHVVSAVNTYDRYLLPMLTLLAILTARGIIWLWGRIAPYKSSVLQSIKWLLVGITMLVLIFSAWNASNGDVHIGGDQGQHEDIDEVAAYLNHTPVATVIYDPWLGWELDFYMGQWTNKRRVHYPNPAALVEDALTLDEIGARYLVAPINQPLASWLDALEVAGFTISEDQRFTRFIIYRLLPPS